MEAASDMVSSIRNDHILYIAKGAEKEGLASVWVFERLLWPLKPQTPYGGTSDGYLPVQYQTAALLNYRYNFCPYFSAMF